MEPIAKVLFWTQGASDLTNFNNIGATDGINGAESETGKITDVNRIEVWR